jgi:hypothetical protein
VTALERGLANTRWRDFADIYLLAGSHEFTAQNLINALTRVADHRTVTLTPLHPTLDGYPEIAQSRWRAWHVRQHLDDRLPEQFSDVLAVVSSFADQLLTDNCPAPTPGGWSPQRRTWDPEQSVSVMKRKIK